jgi:hypothetical protein
MFVFVIFYHRYHLAARTVVQKQNTLVYKIYILVRCACSGYYAAKELVLYFSDGNIVHYLSISPLPTSEFYFVASEQFFFILSL